MIYRRATTDDTKAVYDLICNMENKELPFDRFSEIFREQTASDRYYCLVREDEGRVSGILNLRFEDQLHHTDKIAEIMEFSVDPSMRDRGVGKSMLEEACRVAKKLGCVQIEVACNQLRKDTHRFYLREGMHNFHYKFSKALNGDDSDDNVLGK